MISRKRNPCWDRDVIGEAKRLGVPEGTTRERKNPKSYPIYMALISDLVEKEPTCFEEETKKKECVYAMAKEYRSIINNDVWEIVPRQKEKSVVSSKWIFKKNNSVDCSIEKYKEIFISRGFYKKEGIDYEETFSLVETYTLFRTVLTLENGCKYNFYKWIHRRISVYPMTIRF